MKALVLQHRKEILDQNFEKCKNIIPSLKISKLNANEKDFSGDIVFAMQQTTMKHLNKMPRFDLVVVDEAHHIRANGYKKILDKVKQKNNKYKLLGVTATPFRGDRRSLGGMFDNIAHEITLLDMIEQGHLVCPKTFVLDIGITKKTIKYKKQYKQASESKIDSYVTKLLRKSKVAIKSSVKHWMQRAIDRKTIFFTPSIETSKELLKELQRKGIKAEIIHHKVSDNDRKRILKEYKDGDVQVLCNSLIFTEGWDSPKTSCICILRTNSFKSTYLQIIGRGLRPCAGKENCMILDFGASSFLHGTLEQQVEEALKEKEEGLKIEQRKKEILNKLDSGKYVLSDFNMQELRMLGIVKATSPIKNKIGMRFERLLVVEKLNKKHHNGSYYYRCACDCGNERNVSAHLLSNKKGVRSCGCLQADKARQRLKTHGYFLNGRKHPIYYSWANMKKRCSFVKRWRKFENFLKDMGKKPKGTRLARYNEGKPHGPGNSYWKPISEHKR